MANVQIARQRNAPQITSNTTKLDQKQSLEIVQTMIHGAISTLTYLRELFPQKAYKDSWYESSDTVVRYEDYIAGVSKEDTRQPRTHIPVLQRSRSKRADVFLHWLEDLAFEEIKTGRLRAIQIYIHPEKDRRQEVLESYTFTVHYSVSDTGARVPSGLGVSGTQSSKVTAQNSNIALQQVLRGVNDMCDGMPSLPRKRLLSMELVYDGKLDEDREIAGFVPGTGDDLLYAQAEGWEKRSTTLRHDSGYHSSSLTVSRLQLQDGREQRRGESDFPAFTFHSGNRTSRNANIDMIGFSDTSPLDKQHSSPEARRSSTSKGNPVPQYEAAQQRDLPNAVSAGLRTSSRTLGNDTSGAGSQASLVPEMQNGLRGMMLQEEISQGDTQAQELAPAFGPASNPPESPGDVYRITAKKAQEIRSKHAGLLRQTATKLALQAGSRTRSGKIILCQCGHAKEEGDMVECSVCGTYQHLHCYGYTGREDSRLPDEHICYWCVLGDKDKTIYNVLQQLALERRGVYRVYHHGLRTKTDLAKDLVLDQPTARDLWTEIRSSDFVIQTAKSHKAGFRATGNPLYVPIKEGPKYDNMFRQYFDPMTHIGGHYQKPPPNALSNEAAAFRQRLTANEPASMVPPATPRTGGSRKSVSSTPATAAESPLGLDLPASQPPYKSPSVPAGRQTRASRRPLDTEDAEESPAKRVKTPAGTTREFSTYISEKLIDAGGESSPFHPGSSVKKPRHKGRDM